MDSEKLDKFLEGFPRGTSSEIQVALIIREGLDELNETLKSVQKTLKKLNENLNIHLSQG